MVSSCNRRFDGRALYAAMNAQRVEREVSWQEIARQTGVAASTLHRTRLNGPMETDGILSMAKWLGRPLEDFILGAEAVAQANRKVAQYRFNCKALYAALDAQRLAGGMTWLQTATEIGGVLPPMLTRLAKGGRVDVRLVVRAVGWLGRTVESFSDPAVAGRSDARKVATRSKPDKG